MDPNNNKKEAVIQGIMGEGRYILIVDDDLIRREQLEMVLAFSGEPFKVCTRDLLQENVRSSMKSFRSSSVARSPTTI